MFDKNNKRNVKKEKVRDYLNNQNPIDQQILQLMDTDGLSVKIIKLHT